MKVRISAVAIISMFLSGCMVMLSSSDVTVKELAHVDKGPKIVTIMGSTPYLADMSVALAENGFVVKPMPTQQQITEMQKDGSIAKYNEASTRWAISITTQFSGMHCAQTLGATRREHEHFNQERDCTIHPLDVITCLCS